jgi:uncharacterized Zn finger protein (UPF0148 family)
MTNQQCQKCNGTLFNNYDEIRCISCGWILYKTEVLESDYARKEVEREARKLKKLQKEREK